MNDHVVDVFIGKIIVFQRSSKRIVIKPDLVLGVDPFHTNSVGMLIKVFLQEAETIITQAFFPDVITNFRQCHCRLLYRSMTT